MRSFILAVALGLPTVAVAQSAPIDTEATPETRALFTTMKARAQRGVMFGHQNTLAYGYTWRDENDGTPDRSDVKDVSGKFPAVYGWDVMDLFSDTRPGEMASPGADRLRRYVQSAHARGGISTFSWHMKNPVNNTDAWNTERAVDHIIPGGRLHDAYKAQLDEVAAFFLSVRDAGGKPIPMWFRPFHEHTGGWFWWGKGNTSAQDFKALWQFTVTYLRDVKGVHNLLYAYSTDVFDDKATFFEFYPGDAYVDMIGFDDYQSIKHKANARTLSKRLKSVAKWADERGKIAALTETGLEAVPDPKWWTNILLPGLKATKGISYVLVWRNANPAYDRKDHFYAPYPGQVSAEDFKRFEADPLTLFEGDVAGAVTVAQSLTRTDSLPVGRCINMGNHLEAPTENEWGGRMIADDDFAIIAKAGFTTIRLPVRWSTHATATAPFTIDPAYMKRVAHLVDLARASGLNVILNSHHFEEIHSAPERHAPQLAAMWAQIADRFKDQPRDHAWFEIENEPHDKFNDSNLLATLTPALRAIRKSNPDRPVIIGGQSWSGIDSLATLKLPDDPHIIPTFHYYDPFDFTHQGASWVNPAPPLGRVYGGAADKEKLSNDVQKIRNYIKASGKVPFMGEFGAHTTVTTAERVTYQRAVRTAFDKVDIGMCAWAFTNTFPLYDSKTKAWVPGMLGAMGLKE